MATAATDTTLREIEQTFVDDVWNGTDYDYLREVVDRDYVGHWFSMDGEDTDRQGLEDFIRDVKTAFPDGHMDIEFMLVEDDMCAVGFTMTGTHEGEFMGIPPTGKTGSTKGIMVHRFEDEKMVEGWAVWDALGQFQQLGVIPERFTLTAFLETGANLAKQDVLKLRR